MSNAAACFAVDLFKAGEPVSPLTGDFSGRMTSHVYALRAGSTTYITWAVQSFSYCYKPSQYRVQEEEDSGKVARTRELA